jgi:hypothetical protein
MDAYYFAFWELKVVKLWEKEITVEITVEVMAQADVQHLFLQIMG